MAEIPIERKSGIPWWVWLILALVIALLIWMFSGDDDADRVATDLNPAAVAPVAVAPIGDGAMTAAPNDQAGTGPITDLAMITGASGLTSMIGRPVQLGNVRVQAVVGDRTFWVGPSADQRALVVLNEVPTPNQPGVEGRYDVTTGQVINVNGTIRNINDPAFVSNPIEGLPGGQTAVIHADSLNIVQRP